MVGDRGQGIGIGRELADRWSLAHTFVAHCSLLTAHCSRPGQRRRNPDYTLMNRQGGRDVHGWHGHPRRDTQGDEQHSGQDDGSDGDECLHGGVHVVMCDPFE